MPGSISFFLLMLLFIPINLPYGLAQNTVVMSGLVLLVGDKKATRLYTIVGPSRAVCLEPLAHCGNVASLSLFYRYYFGSPRNYRRQKAIAAEIAFQVKVIGGKFLSLFSLKYNNKKKL